jgi:hypothetical protein
MPLNGAGWSPRTIKRYIEGLRTGTEVVRVETDIGDGYLKVLGNPAGPHALACEWIGTRLAEYLRLPTLDYSLIEILDGDEVPLASGAVAEAGTAFITRAEEGYPWGGDPASLAEIANPEALSGIVVLDTWIRNCDRYRERPLRTNRDNVFFSRVEGMPSRVMVKAIDHTHAFTCGQDLNRAIANIDSVQDERIYGRFPEFVDYLTEGHVGLFVERLRNLDERFIQSLMDSVPVSWQLAGEARDAIRLFLHDRARFVVDTLGRRIWRQPEGTL